MVVPRRTPHLSCWNTSTKRFLLLQVNLTQRRTFHPAYVEAGETKDLSFLESYKHSFDVPRPTLTLASGRVNSDSPPLHKIGDKVTVHGYLGRRRDVSESFCFVPLSGRGAHKDAAIQLISRKASDVELHTKLKNIRYNSAVSVTGVLQRKRLEKGKTSQYTDQLVPQEELEIVISEVTCLNAFPQDIILSDDVEFGLEQRHLQLMGKDLAMRLQTRALAASNVRQTLQSLEYQEVETPILFKSTPEGAREFLVPTRRPGFAYALPQSPQQYKQILMASGIKKYFQFAKCFRDEDLRADRQPEFTQLDLEMSFADGEQVMSEVEVLVISLFANRQLAQSPFPRMSYQDAMDRFGSDKPDLRIKYEIQRIDNLVPESLTKMLTDISDPIIETLKVPISEDPSITRNFVNSFMGSSASSPFRENPHGAPGIFIYDSRKPLQGLQAFGFEGADALHQFFEATNNDPLQDGDLLVVQARPNMAQRGGSTALGRLRLALHSAAVKANHLPPLSKADFHFLWITDFPLFTPDSESAPVPGEGPSGGAGFSPTHHPFTAPKTPKDVDLLLTDPLSAKADHYDLVVNGVELGGGSRRIHSSEMQKFVMRDILKLPPARLNAFSHLFEVLRAGCPPHAGFALGFDRALAVLCGRESIRDVMAFPKNGRGEDALVGSPGWVEDVWRGGGGGDSL